ncbi:ATP-binding protein [Flavobacterium sp. NRK F10]|uniref:ATP-binding protein n=1 Tax=Flavobacterium sp. NRK F10 TaxID=2954931 RepID=UPI0020902250|nr:ATP-binding protein [Flavobacterium sp. NRK F10]MCO6175310.1 ATP-binding protein [Flavobacterium sp. NRK F10]
MRMNLTFFRIFILFFLIVHPLAKGQAQKQLHLLFEKEIEKKCKALSDAPYFKKTYTFFLEKKWDSTLVYSMRQLNSDRSDKTINDYCHFFRGFSFKEKKLFKESQKELSDITNRFFFYQRVSMLLGELALENNESEKAIPYFKKLEALSNPELYGIKASTIKHNLGICYLHLGQFSNAESYLLDSTELQEQEQDTIMLIGSYGDIANLYYEQYKDDQAIPYFIKAYELAQKTKDFRLKYTTAYNMAIVEENRKDFLRSLQYRKEFEKWKDSLNDQNKIWEVAQLEKQFAVKQKQKEVSLLQAENKIKIAERNGLLYSAIVLLVLLITGVYFYLEKIKSNKIILAQKQKLDELNATKDKLFSIVSHDLRSSVNALKTSNSKLLKNLETKNLDELDFLLHQNSAIANSTYNLLDNLLHWALLQSQQSFFEITAMRLFFIVEQISFNYKSLLQEKEIQFENNVARSEMVYADQESLKIILRNLMDNAIKFSKERGYIHIYTRSRNDMYCDLIIEDNGLGMDAATRENLLKEDISLIKKQNNDKIGSGLGLQLCKSMIKKNKGKFTIESELGKGTKMIVSLPKTVSDG